MKRVTAIAAVLLLAPNASATWIHHAFPGETFGETPSPAVLKWELATEAGERVLGFIQTDIPIGTQAYQIIHERPAAAIGFDWRAFEAAVNNPLFTRSIITFGGVERERPAARDFPAGQKFEYLWYVFAAIEDYQYPATQAGITLLPRISMIAGMEVVPEPATWVLVGIGVVAFLSRRQFAMHIPSRELVRRLHE